MLIFNLAIAASCDRTPANVPALLSTRKPTVASLSPAATDLIVAMGLGDHLIAVSNYEPPRKTTDLLPRVGDYRTADWEKIAQLRPDVIITQYHPDKMPDGFADRAARLNIRVFNRKIDSLDDTFNTITELGTELNAPHAAAEAADRWRKTMDRVKRTSAANPRVKTLLIVGESGLSAVGPKTFLSDLLEIAGGRNALVDGGDYPNLDREKLAAVNPDVIIQLLPGASPQTIEQAEAFWRTMPDVAAVKGGAIYQMTDPDVLLPGFNVTRTAERFAEILNGLPKPATQRSPRPRKRFVMRLRSKREDRRRRHVANVPSREAAKDSSLGRKPQDKLPEQQAPKRRKNRRHDRSRIVNVWHCVSFVLSPLRGLTWCSIPLGLAPQAIFCRRLVAADRVTCIARRERFPALLIDQPILRGVH